MPQCAVCPSTNHQRPFIVPQGEKGFEMAGQLPPEVQHEKNGNNHHGGLGFEEIEVPILPGQQEAYDLLQHYGDLETSGKLAAERVLDDLLNQREPHAEDRAAARLGLALDNTPLPEPIRSPRLMRDCILKEWDVPLIRHGDSVAWYDSVSGSYKPWEKNDTFDFWIIEATDVSNRRQFEDSLRRELAAYSREPDAPDKSTLNLPNGILTLDMSSAGNHTISPHTPEYRHVGQLGAAYNPQASSPDRILNFLAQVVKPEYLQLFHEIAGHLCVPDMRYESAFVFQGLGGSGKGTAIEILRAMLGADNCANLSLGQLGNKFNVSMLDGKLVNFASETSFKAMQDWTAWKNITGRDTLTAEKKYGDPYDFAPYVRMVQALDQMGSIADDGNWAQRRMKVVQFKKQVETTDIDLKDNLVSGTEIDAYFSLYALPSLVGLLRRKAFMPVLDRDGNEVHYITPARSFIDEKIVRQAGARMYNKDLRDYIKEYNKEVTGRVNFNSVLQTLKHELNYECARSGGRYIVDCKYLDTDVEAEKGATE